MWPSTEQPLNLLLVLQQRRYQGRKGAEIGYGMKARMVGDFGMFQCPGQAMRDMYSPSTGLKRRDHVRFQRISHHQRLSRAGTMPRKQPGIGLRGLVRNDLDGVEQIAQTGLRQLAFLIQQIALGDQQDPELRREGSDRVGGMGQQISGGRQHRPPKRQNLGNGAGWNTCPRNFYGGFNHRKHEALYPKTVLRQVSPFSRQQSLREMIGGCMVGQQCHKALFGQVKELLVVPKRIVGVKANRGEGWHRFLRGWRMLWRESLVVAILRTHPLFTRRNGSIFDRHHPSESVETVAVTFLPLSMSGPGDDREGQGLLATKTKPKTQRPPMYKVLLLNDDYTPMEFVVHVLERFFGLTHAQSFEIMLTVHKKGLAVVGVFSFEVAETKVAQVMDFARRHQHPLQCTMEKE